MSDVMYNTPQGHPQIVYVWHLRTERPLFSLPYGDFNGLKTAQPDRIVLNLGGDFADYSSRLPLIAWLLTGKEAIPVQYVDAHTGEILEHSISKRGFNDTV